MSFEHNIEAYTKPISIVETKRDKIVLGIIILTAIVIGLELFVQDVEVVGEYIYKLNL